MSWLSRILLAPARQYSDKVAVRQTDGKFVTYANLLDQSTSLAETLTKHGITKGDRVGILMPKSISSVSAILATLRTNGIYVPIDASGPVSRATYILRDCSVKAVFVDKQLSEQLQEELTDCLGDVIELEEADLLILAQNPEQEFPENLAYILYTSGSTGRPKGVMITDDNALCFVDWAIEYFSVTARDILSSIAPFHFDLSIFDLFVSLSQGATLVLFSAKDAKNPMLISAKIESERITTLYATPTLLQLLLRYGKLDRYDHSSLRTLMYAGEVFPPDKLRDLWDKWTTARVFNLYGPTETNVVTSFEVTKEILVNPEISAIPIGKACPFARCSLLINGATNVEPKPAIKGELLVSGQSVALGYQGLPSQTEASFFEENGVRWYRTGDIVSVDAEGNFVFAGRKDRMVKRNGYRIELAEIELALLSQAAFSEVAVIDYLDKKEDIKIIAFIRLSADLEEQPTLLDIRASGQQLLPDYLLPNTYRILENFPLTSSQKIDYQQLKSSL